MSRFEHVLEDCLGRMAAGESLEECLQRYPEFAEELRPSLAAAKRLESGRQVQPSAAFKSRARAQLMAHMRTHPHRRSALLTRGLRPAWQGAVGLAVFVVAFFITGTAFAQSAMPGDTLYGWKLTSETVWRAVSPDPVATDLALAQRRVQELQAVSGPDREIALQGYQEVLVRLESQTGPAIQERIIPVLTDQRDELTQSGISVPNLDEYLSQSGSAPSPLPLTPTPESPLQTPATVLPFEIPTPTIELPQILETPTQ